MLCAEHDIPRSTLYSWIKQYKKLKASRHTPNLKPLINGHGFYHIESQFTDARRMDIVVDYGRNQFIIELKIWYGGKSHREGYSQLLGYMDSRRATVGHLLTFDFRQEDNKERKCEWVESEGKRIFDVIV